MITAVYLSNRNVQVLLGNASREKAQVLKVYETTVPEECLINGIITDKELLADYLKRFWEQNRLPTKNIKLVINSSQFILKSLELPKMKQAQLLEVLDKEFSDVERRHDPIYSYRVLSEQSSSVKILATMTERSFVGGFLELFSEIGVEVAGVNTALGCAVRLLERLPDLKGKTCVIQLMEDNNLTNILWADGGYEYSSRSRLFSDHGTESMGTEVSRTINNLMQFYASLNREEPLKEVYTCGMQEEDLRYCVGGMQSLGMEVGRLQASDVIAFTTPARTQEAGNYVFLLGSLFTSKRDRNLMTSYKRGRAGNAAAGQVVKRILPAAVTLGICTAATAGMLVYNGSLQRQADALSDYLTDPSNVEKSSKSSDLESQMARIARKMSAAREAMDALNSYPRVDSSVESSISKAAGGSVSTEIRSYDAEEGALTLKASSARVESINGFITKLNGLAIFRKVEYSGYTFNTDKEIYDINVICYLSENPVE